MSNDSMRGGPRGSSDQVAWLGPKYVEFVAAANLDPVHFDESASGPQTAFFLPFFPVEEGYKVNRIILAVTETYAATGTNLVVGTNASGSGNVFVNNYNVPNSTGQGSIIDVPLNGAGGGKDPLATGNSAYLVGGSSSQQLTASLTAGSTGNNGAFKLFAELIPVTGSRFSD